MNRIKHQSLLKDVALFAVLILEWFTFPEYRYLVVAVGIGILAYHVILAGLAFLSALLFGLNPKDQASEQG